MDSLVGWRWYALLAFVALSVASTARAESITYTFSGNGGGDASGPALPLTFFSNAAFSVSATGDTAAVTMISPGVFCNEVHDMTIVIAGVGTLRPDTANSIVDDTGAGTWSFVSGTCASLDEIVLGDTDPSAMGYQLASAIGPSTGTSPDGGSAGEGDGAGEANFDGGFTGGLTFQALAGAAPPAPSAVPLPTLDARMLALLALLLAVGVWRRGRVSSRNAR
jgi:hypothetical protein